MLSADDLITAWPSLDIARRKQRLEQSCRVHPGALTDAMTEHSGAATRAAAGLLRRDPSVWSDEAGIKDKIANRLGWLESPRLMAQSLDRLRTFADGIRTSDFMDVVLLGMGGSSLAPEVLRATLGTAAGYPRFQMLDSTDPAAIRAISTTPRQTLYILASKSGGTIEPNSLAAHFRQQLEQAGVPNWADHFIAITDEGTALAGRARAERFREIFINPSDIGGRYSAISFFGLVPAALMGQDLDAMVGWSLGMLACAQDGGNNAAVSLGLAMGAGALAGRDKLTLLLPPELDAFGLWIEQLVAESTGKSGIGVVPIAGEAAATTYGDDRLFVDVRIRGSQADHQEPIAKHLTLTGAPVIQIDVPEPRALPAEFVRWEIATAVAGALLHINPFDEPNVQQAKDATGRLLADFKSTGRLPITTPDLRDGDVTMTLSRAARTALGDRGPHDFLSVIREHDYFALLAFLGPDADLHDALKDFRHLVRDRTHAATMMGYGPRYLHSTGQLHKGGPNTGVFLVISATPVADVSIPGEAFTFGTLELAQALGDFASLDATSRRAMHIHLPSPGSALLRSTLGSLA